MCCWWSGIEVWAIINKYSLSANSNSNSNSSLVTSQDAVERAQQMKKDLLDKLEKLAEDLPPNTLDELIDELGGPENVAEVNVVSAVFPLDNICFSF
jgi:hypothetical protein